MDIRTLICAGALLLLTNHALPTEIKKWVDKNGQVHFSDQPPHDVDNIPVNPEVITTAPSSNNSLKNIMRPGELRLIKNHDKRRKRLIKAKRKALKQAKLEKRRAASNKKKCNYHQRKKDYLRRRLREGARLSEKSRIEQKLDNHILKIEEYCN
jgi:hypothetical protein